MAAFCNWRDTAIENNYKIKDRPYVEERKAMTNPPTPTPTLSETDAAATNIIEAVILMGVNLRALSDEDLQRFKMDAFACAKAITSLQSRLAEADENTKRAEIIQDAWSIAAIESLKARATSAELARDQAVAGMAVLVEALNEARDFFHALQSVPENVWPRKQILEAINNSAAATSARIKMVDELRAERDGYKSQVDSLEAALRGVHGIQFDDGYEINVAALKARITSLETALSAARDEGIEAAAAMTEYLGDNSDGYVPAEIRALKGPV